MHLHKREQSWSRKHADQTEKVTRGEIGRGSPGIAHKQSFQDLCHDAAVCTRRRWWWSNCRRVSICNGRFSAGPAKPFRQPIPNPFPWRHSSEGFAAMRGTWSGLYDSWKWSKTARRSAPAREVGRASTRRGGRWNHRWQFASPAKSIWQFF